jgi:multidrug resistance efflux pump
MSTVLFPETRMPAIARASAAKWPRQVARGLAFIFVAFFVGLFFIPWQQFVTGTGKVIAFDPLDRRINVEAAVSGQVKKLHVVEGTRVKKGQLVVEIEDNDPNLLANLRIQHDALIARKAAAAQRVDDLEVQIRQQDQAKGLAIDAAQQRVASERITAETAVLNFNRIKELRGPGLVSERDFELAKQVMDSSQANLKAAEATALRTGNDFEATIAGIRAQKGTASAELASASRDITTLDITISQTQRQIVEAPRDGIVLSVQATDGTFLRPGSLICVIIPETTSRFVELFMDGNDVPLIREGRDVRLQFEGWPAVQFVGWPSVARGTFGGKVHFIDPAPDAAGKFRVVISPSVDKFTVKGQAAEQDWPLAQLRQGVRANGWILLDRVLLYQEIWRQINNFPPVVAKPEEKK